MATAVAPANTVRSILRPTYFWLPNAAGNKQGGEERAEDALFLNNSSKSRRERQNSSTSIAARTPAQGAAQPSSSFDATASRPHLASTVVTVSTAATFSTVATFSTFSTSVTDVG